MTGQRCVGERCRWRPRSIVRANWPEPGADWQSDMEWTLIYSVRNGRIFSVEYFWDYADALEAAGLSE